MDEKNLARKGHVTFQGQGHVMSRSLILILVANVSLHLCAKFDANPSSSYSNGSQRDRQSNRQTDSYTQVITLPSKRLFERRFAVKN